ncbi:hypothetical protein HJFPF1_02046 [Paramyrothecium foliicola]|nr:hypothetical protein HJFPF1_02046 [Paramyrothecium foliicola]
MDLDSFSDDGLDNLSDSALQEIDRIAIQFTQAQAQTQAEHLQPSQPGQQLPIQQQQRHQLQDQDYSNYSWEEDDDLDTTEVINDSGVPVARPLVNKTFPQQQPQQQPRQQSQRPGPPVPNPQWNPAATATVRSGAASLSTRPRLPSAGPPSTAAFASQRLQPDLRATHRPQASQFSRPVTAAAPSHFNLSQTSQVPPGDIVSALQRRVRALETDLAAARGEASIIRANHNKSQKEHHDEIARLKKLTAEQLAKQERIAEAAVAAEVHANTELEFLQGDIREVHNRARRKDTAPASGAGPASSTTPKKTTKSWGIADGFDDMDIVYSPSKGQGRAKNAGSVALNVGERTPSKSKRKRPMVESPVMALDTHTGDVIMDEIDRPSLTWETPETVVAVPVPFPFDYLPLVLDHGAFNQHPPTFEVLSRLAFPSDPDVSLSSVILQRLPVMGRPGRPLQLLVDFVELVTAMWKRCSEEGFLEPIKYLASLISFTFDLHTTAVASITIASLASVAQGTIFNIAEARHRVSDGDLSKHSEYSILDEHIDSTHILSLLHTSALACTATPIDNDDASRYSIADFWKMITLDTVMLLLSPKQKFDDIIGMLHLLAISALPSSIGPITDDKDPEFVARLVIERVSAKLTDFPRSASDPELKRKIQFAALRALITFAQYPFGAMQLAIHSNALPRLVTCLSTSIDALYDQPIPSSVLAPLPDHYTSESFALNPGSSPSAELCQIISQCVLLVYKLVTDPSTADVVEISQKLSVSHGGSQRYLLALVRLTFAEEDLIMESGIDNEFVEAAHELLEMAVTPDEGEIVSAAFGSG